MKWPLVLLATLAPSLALACPSCARDSSPFSALFIAGMIGAPYAIGYLAVRAIRESDRADAPGVEP
jgi:hypothetical protein